MEMTGNPEAERWKLKFYETLGQLESKEKEWQQLEKTLRQCATRLTTIAETNDDGLRTQLDRLRDALADDVPHEQLNSAADDVVRTMVRLDRSRHSRPKPVGPRDVLLMLVDTIAFPGDWAAPAQELRRRLIARRDVNDFDELRRAFITLVSEAMTRPSAAAEPHPGAAAPTRSVGLLERLFGARHRSGEGSGQAPDTEGISIEVARAVLDRLITRVMTEADGAPLRERLAASHEPGELLAVADEFASLMAHPAPAADTSGGTGEERESYQATQEVLLRLLDRLDIPDELADTADAIRRHLSEEKVADLDQTLAAIADLVAQMRRRVQGEKDDIALFLKTLTARIKEIDAHFQESAARERASFEHGQQLDNDVRVQVDGIEKSVRTASGLDELKQFLQQHVDTIRERMQSFRRDEESRMQQAQTRIRDLTERLALMEGESAQLRERIDTERRRAFVDPLTGIANRLAYDERLQQEYARWKRYRTPLVLMIWDIDYFKRINDSFGHQAGDKVLRVVARLLRSRSRETDLVARYGGEEFVCLLPETGLENAYRIAEQVRHTVQKAEFRHRNERVPITICCGLAEFHEGDDPDAVFARADAALYRAKSNGRNQSQKEECPAAP